MRGKCVYFFLLLVFKTGLVVCDCTLTVKDFGTPSPVYLYENKYLTPNSEGRFRFKRLASLTIACPGLHNYVTINKTTIGYDVAEASCIHNQTFRLGRQFANFKDIKCNRKPHVSTELTNQNCLEGGQLYLVGYKILNKFYEVYTSCFDKNSLRTVYVKHQISPTSRYGQIVSRPNFMEGDVFGKVQIANVYKIANQKKRLDDILGGNMSDTYISKKQFLTRGHLAARADFTLSAEMAATFHYINAAPQWQRENSGDWRLLEDSLRKHAQESNRSLIIYTGTHAVMELDDVAKKQRQIFLELDENNNGIVAVPLYFYKLVYDPLADAASAFVTINSPYYTPKNIKQLIFCADNCIQKWLKWKTDDGFYSFCCQYEEFIEKIGVIDDLNIDDDLN